MNLKNLRARLANVEQLLGKRRGVRIDPADLTDEEWAVLSVLKHCEPYRSKRVEDLTDEEWRAIETQARELLATRVA